jgi:lipid A 3-O-deacylase
LFKRIWVMDIKPGKAAMCIVAFIHCLNSTAQLIDNTSTFRNIPAKSYFRFHYDNDYFTKTDYYYSQGITLEYVHPCLQKSFLSKVLVAPANTVKKIGFSLNLFGYTPTSIRSDSILYGDRPFGSALSFKIFAKATNTTRRQQFASSLQLGIIGPLAQGENIQTGIHRWLKNVLPDGWQHQVQNDVIINYQLNFEKQITPVKKGLLINAVAETRIGTLQNRLSAGINLMAGHFTDPYKTDRPKKMSYYFFWQARTNLILYDALMQGGIFNRKNPYIITAGDITRITFQADAGLILNFPKLYLSYTQSFLSREFRTGRYHRWGGISIGFSL